MNRNDRLEGGKLFLCYYFEYVCAKDGMKGQRTESLAEALK
jgi:hypothetical protein